MKILSVDDAETSLFLMQCIVEDMGMEVVSASSGEAAIAVIENDLHNIGIVLMDVNMPGMDGYEAGKKIKCMAGDHHLPIIFITASTDDEILTKCVAIGDDYIAKPVNTNIVIAKIRAHARIVELYHNLEQQNLALTDYRSHAEDERMMLQSIFDNFYLSPFDDRQRLQRHISPKSIFNGDILLTAKSPSQGMYIMIGDVTGHGLPAAVAAIPVYSVFKSMAVKGACIGAIAAEMNRVLHHLLPPHIMLAATILEVNSSGKRITVWSGGMPNGVIADEQGNIVDFIPSQHAPLSVLADHEFCQNVDLYKLHDNEHIYLLTDGIIESNNAMGEMFGEERFNALFDGAHDNMFAHILHVLDRYTNNTEQDDDISLIELRLPQASQDTPVKKNGRSVAAIPWHLDLELDVKTLQKTEPVTQLLKLLKNAIGLDIHQDYLSTILAELFNNALEHGLLDLDSSIKNTDAGYFDYYQMRKQRLQSLQQGEISINLDFKPSIGEVTIVVAHTGLGFEPKTALIKDNIENDNRYGRGVSIINKLCHSFEYSNAGRTATAIYHLAG